MLAGFLEPAQKRPDVRGIVVPHAGYMYSGHVAGAVYSQIDLSARTIVYKALCTGEHLREFYLDLRDPRFATPFVVFHQRYATNTHPSWWLAQPFRVLAHNGEINTISTNRTWMKARERDLPPESLPLLRDGGSDSRIRASIVLILFPDVVVKRRTHQRRVLEMPSFTPYAAAWQSIAQGPTRSEFR